MGTLPSSFKTTSHFQPSVFFFQTAMESEVRIKHDK